MQSEAAASVHHQQHAVGMLFSSPEGLDYSVSLKLDRTGDAMLSYRVAESDITCLGKWTHTSDEQGQKVLRFSGTLIARGGTAKRRKSDLKDSIMPVRRQEHFSFDFDDSSDDQLVLKKASWSMKTRFPSDVVLKK